MAPRAVAGERSDSDNGVVDRLSIAALALGVPLLLRIVLSGWQPLLALVDLCSLGLTGELWRHANRRRISDLALQRVLGVTALALAVAGALRVAVTSKAEETASVVVVLALFAMVITSVEAFCLMAIVAASAWVVAASATLPLADVMASGAVLVLAGVGGGVYIARYRKPTLEYSPRDASRVAPSENHEIEERLRQAICGAQMGFWHWDLAADRFSVSNHWALDLGCDKSQLIGRPSDWLNRLHPHHVGEVRRKLWAHLSGDADRFDCEYRIQHQDGTYHWAMARGAAHRDENGNVLILAGAQIDLSAVVTNGNSVLDDALKDKLTGLPNRRDLTRQIEHALKRYQTDPSALFAIAIVDLDRFKVLNDSLGHAIGDKLLTAVADRLRAFRREGDLIARFGGDEFVVLFDNLKSHLDALHSGERCRAVLSSPFAIEGQDLSCGFTIGIALCDSCVDKADDLIRNADAALHYAKRNNGSGSVLFGPEMLSSVIELWQLQNDLAHAIEREELRLHYQPIFSLATGRIASAEALMRWKRGDMLVSPSVFIPAAEEMGLIESLGAWALRQGCLQNAMWRSQGWPPIKVAVNVSSKQLQRPGFVELVQETLYETGLPAEGLALELTETALIESLEQTPMVLSRLRRLGVEVAIDDFGTGYSSLSYLHQFDFQTLKIDRSFVKGLVDDPKTAALARGLIGLAHNLNLQVTAEGVETMPQLLFLRLHGCDQIQGYLASRPLEAIPFERLLRSEAGLDQALNGSFDGRQLQGSRDESDVHSSRPIPSAAASN